MKELINTYIKKVETRYSQYFNNEKESNYNNKIKEDAKKIFGEELLDELKGEKIRRNLKGGYNE